MIDGGSPDAAAVTPESLSPGESRPDTNLFLNEKHADIRSSTTSTSILSSAQRFSVLFINAGWKRTYTLSDWNNVTKRQNKQTKIPTSKVKECINNRMRRSTFDCFTIKIFIKIGFMCAGEESEFISNNRRQCRTMSSPFCFLTYKNFPSPG